MARATLIWTAPALDDLDEIASFIALDDPAAAAALVQKVIGAVERLTRFPASGRTVPELPRTTYREVVVAPCRIVYRQDRGRVVVVHVLRGERKLRPARVRRRGP